MPKPNAQAPRTGADAGGSRIDDRRSRARVQPSGAADGITITRWSLGLSLTIALTVVMAAFTLVWNQTVTLGETQVQLVASVSGLDARVTGLETEMRDLRAEMRDLRAEMREEIGGLREEIRGLADLIRDLDRPGPPSQ
ncbi:MAG: hypothetical protein OXH46_01910 [Gemmatimonadetes bacterium]|nr:hypothetical protein [Gemmatimonadota bacterium]